MNESNRRSWLDPRYAAALIETAHVLVEEANRLVEEAHRTDIGLIAALQKSRALVAASHVARAERTVRARAANAR
jgi:hypothetical protein